MRKIQRNLRDVKIAGAMNSSIRRTNFGRGVSILALGAVVGTNVFPTVITQAAEQYQEKVVLDLTSSIKVFSSLEEALKSEKISPEANPSYFGYADYNKTNYIQYYNLPLDSNPRVWVVPAEQVNKVYAKTKGIQLVKVVELNKDGSLVGYKLFYNVFGEDDLGEIALGSKTITLPQEFHLVDDRPNDNYTPFATIKANLTKLGVYEDSNDGGNQNGGTTNNGGNSGNDGNQNNGSQNGGTTDNGGNQNGGTSNGGNTNNGNQNGGTTDNGSQNNGSQNNGSQNNGSQNGGNTNNGGSQNNGSQNNGSSTEETIAELIRLGDSERIGTSIKIAQEALKGSKMDNVILAYYKDFPDSLSASALSAKYNAPIILCAETAYSSKQTLDFVQSNLKSGGQVIIVGGEGVIDSSVVQALKNRGISNVKRLGGSDRYATNAAIIKDVNPKQGTPVIVASAASFADALSISSISSYKGYPIILSNPTMEKKTKDLVASINPSKVYIVGGTGVISSTTENYLKSKYSVKRLGGATRYETTQAIFNEFYDPNVNNSVMLAYSADFPDALAGSYLGYKTKSLMLLVSEGNYTNYDKMLANKKLDKVYVLGGKGVVSDKVANHFKK